jgi:hypothetical protein
MYSAAKQKRRERGVCIGIPDEKKRPKDMKWYLLWFAKNMCKVIFKKQ